MPHKFQLEFMNKICRKESIIKKIEANRNSDYFEPLESPPEEFNTEFWLAQLGCLINKPIRSRHCSI